MIKNIFFDFDGVILDSVNAKADAFYELYLPYGKEVAKKVVEHHKANGGISRFEKIPYYHKTFLNQNINSEQLNDVCEKFSKIVFDKVVSSRPVPGIEEFLETYYQKLNFWVISATPDDEIKKIVKTMGLEKYFIGVYGSPQTKIFWLKKIINENSLSKDESVLIGDSLSDYHVAIEINLKFILRETMDIDSQKFSSKYISKKINNFIGFKG